ncbi:MAG: matrixin family metalloprotease, partial [bacterium]
MLNLKLILRACLALLLTVFGATTWAFKVNTYNGNEIKWSDSSLPEVYHINQNGTPDCDGEFGAIQAAYAAWENVPTSYMDFSYGGTTPSTNWGTADGVNLNVWIESNWTGITGAGSGTIAINLIWFYTDGRLIDSDIAYNGENFAWSCSGEAGKMDVQNIATHEIGHSLSLADLYESGDSQKTMYGYSSLGETKKRTLHSDDIAGISYLYPSGATDSEPPTMEPIVEAEGQYYDVAPTFSNFGFDDNVDLDDGWYQIDSYTGAWTALFTDVSGPSWDDDGWSIPGFGGLTEGSHTIYFKADDDSGNVAGLSGEWNWQFYKDTTDPTISYNSPEAGSTTDWYTSDPGNIIDIDFGWVA